LENTALERLVKTGWRNSPTVNRRLVCELLYAQYTQHYRNNMGVADDCNKNVFLFVLLIRFEAITSAVFDPFSWECKYMTLNLV
jgi:hypothetical protein